MADALNLISLADQAAYLSGVLNVNLQNASFKNSSGKVCSFFVQTPSSSIPLANYAAGLISSYDMISAWVSSPADPNTSLFNTITTTGDISETFGTKGSRLKVPFQNYDILVSSGSSGQDIVFNVVMCGTEYLKAFYSLMGVLFDPAAQSTGTLVHPFYGTIKNCLPRRIANAFKSTRLNCIVFDLIVETSDITHLVQPDPKSYAASKVAEAFILTQTALFGITSAISNISSIVSNVK